MNYDILSFIYDDLMHVPSPICVLICVEGAEQHFRLTRIILWTLYYFVQTSFLPIRKYIIFCITCFSVVNFVFTWTTFWKKKISLFLHEIVYLRDWYVAGTMCKHASSSIMQSITLFDRGFKVQSIDNAQTGGRSPESTSTQHQLSLINSWKQTHHNSIA